MSIDVVMPQMGESVAEGTIIKWLVKEGDTVDKDDPLFEISTDKVDAEVPSPAAGTIGKILLGEGETVEVGTKVAEISGNGAGAPSPAAEQAAPVAAAPSPAPQVASAPAPAPAAATATQSAPSPGGGVSTPGGGVSTPVIMPQMGESVAEGTIIKWIVHEGDSVDKDDPLFEISTDKVDAEVPSPTSGIVTKILVPEGETVEVGVAVAEIAAAGGAPANAPVASSPHAAPASAQAAHSAPAPVTAPRPAAPAPSVHAPAVSATALAEANRAVRSSPVARRIARENNVDLSRVAGTGRNGRVSKNDVLGYVASGAVTASAPPFVPGSAPASPKASPGAAPMIPAGYTDPGGSGIGIQPVLNFPDGADSIIQDMTNIRQIIAKHMLASRATSAHVQSATEVDFGRVMALRKKWKADFTSRHDANLSVTTMVLFAIIPALRNWPIVNASIVNGNQVEYHRHINLGVAAALPDGLIVPVIKQAEQKGIGQIARELADLAGRARSKNIAPDEVSGSTFTVTNPGVFGTDFGLPVINQPNVAILGLGGIKKRVKVIESEFGDAMAIRPTSIFCLSYDHRIIDGAVSSQFLEEVRERIENFPEDVLGR